MVLNNISFGIAASAAALVVWYRYRTKPTPPPAPAPKQSESVQQYRDEPLRRVCVFCGSRSPPGRLGQTINREAKALARLFVRHGVDLVYGGGSVGVMGVVAKSVHQQGGNVYGVIPSALCPKEASGGAIQPGNVTITRTMHQRKRMMAEMSDAFIALPGGFGTFEELFEMITWTQLGIHRKTIGVLNVGGYYDKLLAFLDEAVENGFISRDSYEGIVVAETTAQALFDRLACHTPPKGFLNWSTDES